MVEGMKRTYSVLISKAAQRGLAAIQPKKQAQRMAEKIRALAEDPHPPGSEPIKTSPGSWRIRQGDWRAIYTVNDGELVVVVVDVRRRNERTY
jgi:mRNA interferase RelE/StbE